MSESPPSTTRSAERFLRRWPWWVALVAAVAVGIVAVPVFRQRAAIRWVEEHGGYVITQPGWATSRIPNKISQWLKGTFGEDWSQSFDPVTSVVLSESFRSDDLKRLRQFTKLVVIYAYRDAKFTDTELLHLGTLKRLNTLTLANSDITDVGFSYLEQFEQIQTLSINGANITDEGLLHLLNLEQLRTLILRDAGVTGAGLAQLKALKHLETLLVYNSRLTDAGLAELKELKQLKSLCLSSLQMTDAGISNLGELAKLTDLTIKSPELTDADLLRFQGLVNLKDLWFDSPNVTDAGLATLRKVMPNCDIKRTPEY